MINSSYKDPKIWGPYFWFMMRCIAYNYPNNPSNYIKHHTKEFYNNFKYILPCKESREHYVNTLKKYQINLENREKLMSWLELVYNEIERNKKTNITVNILKNVSTKKNITTNTKIRENNRINNLKQNKKIILDPKRKRRYNLLQQNKNKKYRSVLAKTKNIRIYKQIKRSDNCNCG